MSEAAYVFLIIFPPRLSQRTGSLACSQTAVILNNNSSGHMVMLLGGGISSAHDHTTQKNGDIQYSYLEQDSNTQFQCSSCHWYPLFRNICI
jgi:hypothetical protein